MRAFKLFLLPVLLTVLLITSASAQEDKKDFRRLAIELDGGATYPNMDVDGLISMPMGQGGIRYNFTDIFSLKGEFGMGSIEGGEDLYNREFTNEYMRYGLLGQINVGKMMNFQKNGGGIGLQFKGGISRIHTEITEIDQGDLRDGFTEEGFTSEELAATMGGILQFKLSKTISLNLGGTYHMATTDLMDGFSANVVANNYDDRYVTGHLGLSFNIGSGDEHADWVDMSGNKKLKDKTSSNQKSIKELHNKLDDADNDGVINEIDEDNATQEDVRTTTKGVPMDTDYDGIPDYMDECPVDSGSEANEGCPQGWDSLRKARAERAKKEKERMDREGSGDRAEGRGSKKGSGGQGKTGGNDRGTSSGEQAGKKQAGSGDRSGRSPAAGKRSYSEEEVREYTKIPAKSKGNPSQASEFYIIGGSFNSKANAIDYKEYLESEGFNAEILFVESKNLFRVSFKRFTDYQSAKDQLEEIRTNFKEGAWILMI